jgi:hypothetical protein
VFAKQLFVEFKRAFTIRNILIWMIILFIPVFRFFMVIGSYEFFVPIEVFQEMISGIIPLLFPAIIIAIYLPTFLEEQRNNFIQYTRPRIPLNMYLLCKGIVNAVLTGLISFLLVFGSCVFVLYVEPNFDLVSYAFMDQNATVPDYTFSQFLSYGDLTYGLIYAIWVSINAILYSTFAFVLLLTLNNSFVALSAPFLYYHVFNFVSGVLGRPHFSPLSTIFPFNIIEQPLWTVLIPFVTLLIAILAVYLYSIHKREEWVI